MACARPASRSCLRHGLRDQAPRTAILRSGRHPTPSRPEDAFPPGVRFSGPDPVSGSGVRRPATVTLCQIHLGDLGRCATRLIALVDPTFTKEPRGVFACTALPKIDRPVHGRGCARSGSERRSSKVSTLTYRFEAICGWTDVTNRCIPSFGTVIRRIHEDAAQAVEHSRLLPVQRRPQADASNVGNDHWRCLGPHGRRCGRGRGHGDGPEHRSDRHDLRLEGKTFTARRTILSASSSRS